MHKHKFNKICTSRNFISVSTKKKKPKLIHYHVLCKSNYQIIKSIENLNINSMPRRVNIKLLDHNVLKKPHNLNNVY